MLFSPSKSIKTAKNGRQVHQKSIDYIQVKINFPYPSKEPEASLSPNQDFKDVGVLCTLKTSVGSHNFEDLCVKYNSPYPNQD